MAVERPKDGGRAALVVTGVAVVARAVDVVASPRARMVRIAGFAVRRSARVAGGRRLAPEFWQRRASNGEQHVQGRLALAQGQLLVEHALWEGQKQHGSSRASASRCFFAPRGAETASEGAAGRQRGGGFRLLMGISSCTSPSSRGTMASSPPTSISPSSSSSGGGEGLEAEASSGACAQPLASES